MKGGKCSICGYNKNLAGLLFHHTNPSIKELKIDARHFSNTSWDRLLEEAKNYIVLCHNCHMELHYPHLENK